jgi:hypothetical protein
MTENTIRLIFADKETVDYIRLVCTRKGITLESYIIDNFEWDDKLPCLVEDQINEEICDGCQYIEVCPDGVFDEQDGE